jgi:MFS family permease
VKLPFRAPQGSLWRHADFLRLWSAQSVSAVGARITREGLPLAAVLTLKASPAQLGVLAALSLAPGLIVGLTAGGFVDRSRRRGILIGADLARMAVLLTVPIAAWLHILTMAQLYVAAVLVGGASILFEIADHAYLPGLVGRDLVLEANAKLSVTDSLAEIAGPALAGVLIQWLAAPMALAVNAATYLVSALFLGGVRTREAPPPAAAQAKGHLLADLRAGTAIIWASPLLRPLFLTAATGNLFIYFFASLYVVFAIRSLGLTPALLGVTVAVGGVSALIGALFGPAMIRRLGIGPAYLVAGILAAASALLIPMARGTGASAMLFLVLAQLLGDGFGVIAGVASTSLRQSVTPPESLGRVGAVFQAGPGGLAMLGALAGGLLAGRLGIRPTLVIAALGYALAPAWCLFSPLARLRDMPTPTAPAP